MRQLRFIWVAISFLASSHAHAKKAGCLDEVADAISRLNFPRAVQHVTLRENRYVKIVKLTDSSPASTGAKLKAAPVPPEMRKRVMEASQRFRQKVTQYLREYHEFPENKEREFKFKVPGDAPERKLMLTAYRLMHDAKVMSASFSKILKQAAELELEKDPNSLTISPETMLQLYGKRILALGWDRMGVVKPECCQGYTSFQRDLLAEGVPFIDYGNRDKPHGSDTHLIQILLISEELERISGKGSTQRLLKAMGDPDSGRSWPAVFDEFGQDHPINAPEVLRQVINFSIVPLQSPGRPFIQ
jgi:hypothetical protein